MIMWVADHFGNAKSSIRFERAMALGKCCGAIGNFAEDGTEEHDVEARLRDVRPRRIPQKNAEVIDTGPVGSSLEPFDHRGLDLDPDGAAIG